jgi:hypothetical protein
MKNAVIPLVAFYDIHGRKREVLLLCPGHHTRYLHLNFIKIAYIFLILFWQIYRNDIQCSSLQVDIHLDFMSREYIAPLIKEEHKSK